MAKRWAIATVSVLAVLYLARLGLLFIGADEGDIPSATLIPAPPTGAQILSEGKDCASGGCWWEVVVVPATGQSIDELASEMGVADEQHVAGNFWDPRTITIGSRVVPDGLMVYAQY
jgi:hypothetical protein